ncbi:MAG: carbonic anhydrase [Planctomycetota bacterium]
MTEQRVANLGAGEARQRLQEGNERYRSDRGERPHSDGARRQALVDGQRPFASVLTCADSRVPPELIFDCGLGDLFVVRVAGNIADDAALGSLEYASLHLGVNLVVVMGHRSCGAVGAAVDNADFDGPATHSHVDALIEAIRPAVREAKQAGTDDLLERSVRQNAMRVGNGIRTSEPVLAGLVGQGVQVHASYYDLQTGQVEWL